MLEVRNACKVFYRGKPDEKIALNDLNIKLNTGGRCQLFINLDS